MPVTLVWPTSRTPDEVCAAARTALVQGQTLLLPTEVGPVLAVAPTTLTTANPYPQTTRYDAYFDVSELRTAYPDVTPTEYATLARWWPSGVAVHLVESANPVWVPQNTVAGALLQHLSPLACFVPHDGTTLSADVVLEGVPVASGTLTEVELRDRWWSVRRPGMVSETELRERLARTIVFVCTGNTCRSPMAEALFKHALAAKLGCDSADLLAHGYRVLSAGVATSDGHPATPEAVDTLRTWGLDLGAHRSQMARAELLARADEVVCMTRNHLLTIASRSPVLPGALRLLGGAAGDIDDPIGGSPAVYEACAQAIRQYVERLITEMGLI